MAFGGIETLQLQILENLDSERYLAALVMPAPIESIGIDTARLAELDVPLFLMPDRAGPLAGAGRVMAVQRILRESGADIAHIQTRTPEASRLLTAGAVLARAPARVRTEHVSPGPHVDAGTRRRVAPFDLATDLVITDSEGDRIQQIELVGRDPDMVVASHCGIDLSRFDPNHDVARAKIAFGLDPEVTVIGTVARLHVQKGIRFLVEAAALISERSAEAFELLIVGDGPEEAAIRDQVDAAGLTSRVHFAGFRDDPLPLMHAMDIAAMPSLWEGFSISMQELMALGKPLVTSDHHSFREAITDGVHGLIVPMENGQALADALLRLLADTGLRHRLGAAASERANAEFSIERHTLELMSLYDGVIDGCGRSG